MKSSDLQHTWQEIWVTRRLLLISAVIVLCSIGVLVAGYSLWGQIRLVNQEKSRSEAELNKARQRAQILLDITDEDRAEFDRAGIALPLFKEPLLVLRNLERVSADTQVQLGEIKINPGLVSTDSADTADRETVARSRSTTRTPSRVRDLEFEVEITGQFGSIAQAIEAIENLAPLMEVTELSLDPRTRTQVAESTDVSEYEYVATVQLRTFYAELNASSLARGTAVALTPQQRAVQEQLGAFRTPQDVGTQVDTAETPEFENNNLFGL